MAQPFIITTNFSLVYQNLAAASFMNITLRGLSWPVTLQVQHN